MSVANFTRPSLVTQRDLEEIFRMRHSNFSQVGWAPQMRRRFNYFNPDEYYEAVVNKLVTTNCAWLDVGCGHDLFPSNVNLARILANRCALLVGIDPDETIEENGLVHHRVRSDIENFQTEWRFDVVTLRMVAEHIGEPQRAVSSLSRLTKSGGKVVLYTVNRRSPVSLVSWITPFSLHNPIKRLLWETEEKDTFPVYYRMNTRQELASVFQRNGFKERAFDYLDDCRTFSRFRSTMFLELSSWRILHAMGILYPENCLLGVYERL